MTSERSSIGAKHQYLGEKILRPTAHPTGTPSGPQTTVLLRQGIGGGSGGQDTDISDLTGAAQQRIAGGLPNNRVLLRAAPATARPKLVLMYRANSGPR
jgi:hypothetical protein